MEKHFFLENGRKSRFCVEYLPENYQNIDTGVIICTPIKGERIRTHRIFYNLAREICKRNLYAIRFDFFGDGNSSGESHELNFESMMGDVEDVYLFVLKEYNLKKFYIIGYRIGASVANLVMDQINPLKVILIDPVVNPLDYLQESLRANLTSQMTRYKKIILNRNKLIEEIKENKLINADGFLIGKEMWESFARFSPLRGNNKYKGKVLVLNTNLSKNYKNQLENFIDGYKNFHIESIDSEIILTSWKFYQQRPTILFNQVLREIVNEGLE